MSSRKKNRPHFVDFETTIETVGAGGDGVGQHDGQPVYVPKTAPGERVRVRAEKKSDAYYAQVLKLETASAERVAAPCPHYEDCGGCAFQHIRPEAYQDWKAARVRTVLDRAGIAPEIWESPAFLDAATRRRTTMAVLRTGETLLMGYHAPRSHRVVPVDACLILDPLLDQKIQAIKPLIARLAPVRTALDLTVQIIDGAFDVVLTGAWRKGDYFTLEQNEALAALINEMGIARVSLREKDNDPAEMILSQGPVMKRFGALRVALPPGAFLQASEAGESALRDFVLAHARGFKRVADLFCGSGTFTGPLLETGAEVYAADSEAEAIAALKNPRLRAERRNLFKEPLNLTELARFEAVVIDPPRAGAKDQFEALAQSDLRTIVSISCNPATFARDARTLLDGGYTLKNLKLIDQFVWSAHVEVAGAFVRG